MKTSPAITSSFRCSPLDVNRAALSRCVRNWSWRLLVHIFSSRLNEKADLSSERALERNFGGTCEGVGILHEIERIHWWMMSIVSPKSICTLYCSSDTSTLAITDWTGSIHQVPCLNAWEELEWQLGLIRLSANRPLNKPDDVSDADLGPTMTGCQVRWANE